MGDAALPSSHTKIEGTSARTTCEYASYTFCVFFVAFYDVFVY